MVPEGAHRSWVRWRGQCAPGGAVGSASPSGGTRGSCPQVPAVPRRPAAVPAARGLTREGGLCATPVGPAHDGDRNIYNQLRMQ